MQKNPNEKPRIWFPAIKANTGADVFTQQLVCGLNSLGYNAEITWLPSHAEYLPWMVNAPSVPDWADIVHVNSWLPTKFISKKLPVVSTIHHSIYDPRLKSYKGFTRSMYHEFWIKKIERKNTTLASQVVAVSREASEVVGSALGRQDIKVIYNGVSTSHCIFEDRKIPSKPFKLLYLGSWMNRKGVDLFAPIMDQLGSGFTLSVVGEKPSKYEQSSHPKNIFFVGRIENRSDLFQEITSCDALLFPSRSEGLSLGLIEAQLCGLPAICANCSSMPEVIAHRVNGLICEPDDVDGFVSAIRLLSQNTVLWRAMRLAAHEGIKSKFSLEHQISCYAELYQRLMVKHR